MRAPLTSKGGGREGTHCNASRLAALHEHIQNADLVRIQASSERGKDAALRG